MRPLALLPTQGDDVEPILERGRINSLAAPARPWWRHLARLNPRVPERTPRSHVEAPRRIPVCRAVGCLTSIGVSALDGVPACGADRSSTGGRTERKQQCNGGDQSAHGKFLPFSRKTPETLRAHDDGLGKTNQYSSVWALTCVNLADPIFDGRGCKRSRSKEG